MEENKKTRLTEAQAMELYSTIGWYNETEIEVIEDKKDDNKTSN